MPRLSKLGLVVGIVGLLGAVGAALPSEGTEVRFMQDPDIHGDTIVFSYENDLWTVGASGGTAARVTSWP
ncbi:MAG TPA: hypothetical protein PKL08_12090, partial [Thermoanaerobaculaceae bacterium]|nr:hypothetical protein [Thermoanaerobaculaceae bacterium]